MDRFKCEDAIAEGRPFTGKEYLESLATVARSTCMAYTPRT
jgi:hypothetical protein